MHDPSRRGRLLEDELASRDLEIQQVILGSLQGFRVSQRETKSMGTSDTSIDSLVLARSYMRVAADHAAQVAAPILIVLDRPLRECTGARELVLQRKVGPPIISLLRT